jgi:ceramide glucosyltransferase
MIDALFWGLASVGMLAQLVTVALVIARSRRPAASCSLLVNQPVTLLRPVRGIDPHDPETLRSAFLLDDPGYEVIFCAHSADDPAVALVRHLIAEHPSVPARLLIGENRALRNPKLSNLYKGWRAARYDWICMADANLRLPPDYLRRVRAAWGPRTGMVTSPALGDCAEGGAGHLECAILNTNQMRLQLAADSLGHGFAQGKTMMFNRPLLENAGGLAALDRLMAEDVNATRLMARLGLRVSLTRMPFTQPVGRRTLRQVWTRQVRWALVRREGFPLLYLAEPLNGAVLPALGCGVGAAISGISPLVTIPYLALWYGSEALMARIVGWPMGWRDLAVAPMRDLLLPAIWVAGMLQHDFDWRGAKVTPAGDAAARGVRARPA